jgi:hypothetical protein
VPALEPVVAWRVVTRPDALDRARWHGEQVHVLRLAPDEALGVGATGVDVDDPDAIAEPEAGVSTTQLSAEELEHVMGHVEWELPDLPAPAGTVVQGKIAGVPAKLLLGKLALLVVQTCYVHDLRTRLGW